MSAYESMGPVRTKLALYCGIFIQVLKSVSLASHRYLDITLYMGKKYLW